PLRLPPSLKLRRTAVAVGGGWSADRRSLGGGWSGGPWVSMSEHKATVRWAFAGGDFLKGRYSREHTWTFDGGMTIAASPSPAAVPKPFSNEAPPATVEEIRASALQFVRKLSGVSRPSRLNEPAFNRAI